MFGMKSSLKVKKRLTGFGVTAWESDGNFSAIVSLNCRAAFCVWRNRKPPDDSRVRPILRRARRGSGATAIPENTTAALNEGRRPAGQPAKIRSWASALFELVDHVEDVVAHYEERGDRGQSGGNPHYGLKLVDFCHQQILLGLDVTE